MKTSIACVVMLAQASFSFVAAAQEVPSFWVADTLVRIPAPDGFFRYDGRHPEVDKIARRIVGTKRLVAAYSSRQDLEQALSGRYPRLERHFSVQTNPELESETIDSELFDLLKQKLRQDFADGLAKYEDTIKEVESDGSAAVRLSRRFTGMKISEVIPLGFFDESADSSCFSMLMQGSVSAVDSAEPPKYITVSVVCVLRVHDRLLYLSCSSKYEGKPDIEWARRSILRWRDSVRAANAL